MNSNKTRIGIDVEWKVITGYEDYEISNTGLVRSNKKDIPKLLSLREDKDGYVISTLFKNGYRKDQKVHRLVAKAFVSNSKNKPCVNHLNGIKNDNRYINLEWCTRSENDIHAFNNGLRKSVKGEKCGASKLTKKEVLEIKDKYIPRKVTYKKLAEQYNINKSQIERIVNGKNWKHV